MYVEITWYLSPSQGKPVASAFGRPGVVPGLPQHLPTCQPVAVLSLRTTRNIKQNFMYPDVLLGKLKPVEEEE